MALMFNVWYKMIARFARSIWNFFTWEPRQISAFCSTLLKKAVFNGEKPQTGVHLYSWLINYIVTYYKLCIVILNSVLCFLPNNYIFFPFLPPPLLPVLYLLPQAVCFVRWKIKLVVIFEQEALSNLSEYEVFSSHDRMHFLQHNP